MAATPWSDAITSALTYIDDVRLTEDLQIDPALFFRRMSAYVKGAIPLLNRPPEFYAYITKDMDEPDFADYEWVSDTASLSSATTLYTHNTDFSLVSCVTREVTGTGSVILTPYTNFQYNANTGGITMPIQTTEGVQYEFDFYDDGSFQELNVQQMRLLALAIALVWDERFERNWLNLQMKIKDQSFSTVNESNYMEKSNVRLMENTQRFNDELRKYEQDIAYNFNVKNIRTYQ